MESSELVEIDCDLIRQMKLEGRHLEAKKLIEAFRRDVKKNKEQARKEWDGQIKVVKVFLKMCKVNYCSAPTIEGSRVCERHKHLGILRYCIGCNVKLESRRYRWCEDCFNTVATERRRKFATKNYCDRKAGGLCVVCGKQKPEWKKVHCKKCGIKRREAYRLRSQLQKIKQL